MVTIGEGVRGDDDKVVQVCGYFIDVTDALHRDLAAATRIAVEGSAASRAAIEQAKGSLMITYGLDEDEAFALLRLHSQHQHQTPGHRLRHHRPSVVGADWIQPRGSSKVPG